MQLARRIMLLAALPALVAVALFIGTLRLEPRRLSKA